MVAHQRARGSLHRLQQPQYLAEQTQLDARPDAHDRAADLDLDRRRAGPAIRHHRNEVGSLRAGLGYRIGNRRSEISPPAIELVAMQPVAQRDLARLRTRRLALSDDRRLLLIGPASPARCPSQDFHATETVPINWQITWHTIPLPRSTRQDHPIRVVLRKVGIRLRLPSSRTARRISSGRAASTCPAEAPPRSKGRY